MGYRRMTVEDLYDIFRRWHQGQSIKRIARATERDRKTVREYLKNISAKGFSPGCRLPEKEKIYAVLHELIPQTERQALIKEKLKEHLEEIRNLIHDEKEPVKPKTAWLIVKEKYRLKGSYESFKVFCRQQGIKRKPSSEIIRIELEPGIETQLDYGKMGTLYDAKEKRNRAVHAFCGILSCSRLPYIEYCFSQDQRQFVRSNVRMFEYYGGVTEVISVDNMKQAVIKPDLYEPQLNRSYQEMAEYYGTFIDPCRVYKATDNGKVERMVPSARELFRRLKAVHPTETLSELNKRALKWCKEEYGQKEHGTTKIAPVVAFKTIEKAKLKPLVEKRFEVPVWKYPKVHPDRFFSFDTKRYSLPQEFVGKRVSVKMLEPFVYIYYEYRLIRSYLIPVYSATYKEEDFPEVKNQMLNGGYPKYLLAKSREFGQDAFLLVEYILKPHAYLNARRAQGVIEVFKQYSRYPFFSKVCQMGLSKGVKLPRTLKVLFEEEKKQLNPDLAQDRSRMGKEMIRDIDYYLN